MVGLLSLASNLSTPVELQQLMERAKADKRPISLPVTPVRVQRVAKRLGKNGPRQIPGGYEAGPSCSKLARQFGISKPSVLQVLRDQGVTMRPPHKKY